MGISLVKAALEFASERGLGHAETRLLVYMSTVAIDKDTQPRYWGGRDKAAAALGATPERIRDEWNANPNRKRDLDLIRPLDAKGRVDRSAPESATDLAHARVQAAVRALIEAGAIERASQGFKGQTTVYRLIHEGKVSNLPNLWEGEDSNLPNSPNGEVSILQRGGLKPAQGWSETTPKEEQEQGEEAARAEPSNLTLMPFTLTTVPEPAWDAHLPEPKNATEAARCRRHPTGTSDPCGACGENRQAWVTEHGKRERSRKPAPLQWRVDRGRRICDNRDHQPAADGTCANCEIHPEDLAALLIGAHA